MLLHAGLVVMNHVVPADRAVAATQPATLASASSGLAQALVASMCRPQGLSGGADQPPTPSEPTGQSVPCLVCCCPTVTAMVLPFPTRCPHPRLEPLLERVAWQARQILIRDRISERPPVRGPPAAA